MILEELKEYYNTLQEICFELGRITSNVEEKGFNYHCEFRHSIIEHADNIYEICKKEDDFDDIDEKCIKYCIENDIKINNEFMPKEFMPYFTATVDLKLLKDGAPLKVNYLANGEITLTECKVDEQPQYFKVPAELPKTQTLRYDLHSNTVIDGKYTYEVTAIKKKLTTDKE